MIWTEKDTISRQHALLLRIRLSNDHCGNAADEATICGLHQRLRTTVESASVGEFDSYEWGRGFFTAFMYGPDADKLFDAVAPVILAYPAPRGSYVVKRYGGVGAVTRLVNL